MQVQPALPLAPLQNGTSMQGTDGEQAGTQRESAKQSGLSSYALAFRQRHAGSSAESSCTMEPHGGWRQQEQQAAAEDEQAVY